MTVAFENAAPLVPEVAQTALAVENMSIRAGGSPLVRAVSFTVARGNITAIVGESGSGKSLTARACAGLLPGGLDSEGRVTVSGTQVDVQREPEKLARLRGSGTALLLQDPFTSLSPVHKVGRQIGWTLKVAGGQRDRSRGALRDQVYRSLTEVNLPERVAGQYPHELSGGMRQRAALAAALAARPAVLIEDEPTTALDASTQAEVLDLIAQLRVSRGMAVVLISHDLTLVRGHADDVVVMHAGSIVEYGPARKVLDTPAHPYSAGLKEAAPRIGEKTHQLPSVPWVDVGRPALPEGTSFGDGYRTAPQARAAEAPILVELEPGWRVGVFPIDPGSRADAQSTNRAERTPVETEYRDVISDIGSAAQPLLRVESLGKSFGGRPVVRAVDLEVGVGESVGIVGESGSGKSTLARCIVGLEVPDSGRIHFEGGRDRARGRDPRSVQIVFQDPYSALNPALTIGHALREALQVGGRPPAEAEALLGLVGLDREYLSRRPSELSGGQRQRVAIARALAPRPRLLLCDESVSALDVSIQAQILNLLADLRRDLGLSLLFISHDLAVIQQISDRVYVLNEGAVVESGSTESILSAPEHPYTRQLLSAALAGQRNEEHP